MVGLVGSAAGVHEGEHAGNQQGGLVVRDRERPRKDGAGLSVLPLAVGEKEGIRSAVAVAETAALADKAARHRRVVFHPAAALEDKVVHDDAMADVDGSDGVGTDTSVAQAAGSADGCMVSDPDAVDIAGVADEDMVPDAGTEAFLGGGIVLGQGIELFDQLRTVAVHGHDVGRLGVHPVKDFHFPAAGFAQDGNFHPVAETSRPVHEQQVHVFDQAVRSDVVIGDIVGDVVDQAAVSDTDIVEAGMVDPAGADDSARQGERALQGADGYVSGEFRVRDVFYTAADFYAAPVLRTASGGDELPDLRISQGFVCFHYLKKRSTSLTAEGRAKTATRS